MVDLPRSAETRSPRHERLWVAASAALGLCLVLVFTLGWGTPAKHVSRAAVYTAKVERGELSRRVRGPGTLVPKDLRWVTATTTGRVQAILVEAGAEVDAETVVIQLANPDMELQALEAHSELARAEAELVSLRARLDTEQLELRSSIAGLEADEARSTRGLSKDEALWDQGAVTEDELEQSRESALRSRRQVKLGRAQLSVLSRSRKSQVEAQEATVARLAAVAAFRREQVDALAVTAGAAGILREMSLEEGQWVTPGTVMAKVIKPGKLAAELKIPEAQASELARGQPVSIDTHEAVLEGVVARVDPAVESGSVTVEIELRGELPRGARPDLSVDGEIEIERLADVVHVARPVGAPTNAAFTVYRLAPGGEAEAVSVRFGRGSVDRIEVLSELAVGDEIIISDTSAWTEIQRLVLDN